MYTDPKIRNAFIKAIKSYFADNNLEETDKLGPRKFNKKYFDTLDGEMNPGEKPAKTLRGKKGPKDE